MESGEGILNLKDDHPLEGADADQMEMFEEEENIPEEK